MISILRKMKLVKDHAWHIRKLQVPDFRLLALQCLSFCLHVSNRELINGFLWNLVLTASLKRSDVLQYRVVYTEPSRFSARVTRMTPKTFLGTKNISERNCREIRVTDCMLGTLSVSLKFHTTKQELSECNRMIMLNKMYCTVVTFKELYEISFRHNERKLLWAAIAQSV